MKNSLRIRFTVTAIVSVLLVLVVMVSVINLMNYKKVVSDSDRVLGMLLENGGSFPEHMKPEQGIQPEPPKEMHGGDRTESPELAFETRYFSVVIDSNGNVLSTDTGNIAAVNDDAAAAYATDIYGSHKNEGFVGDYRYSCTSTSDGDTLIVFCDCGPGLSNFSSFLGISILISACSLILISIVVFLLSGRAVSPIVESHERQKRFITDAGHEIKTPLAIINADADVLLAETSEDNEWVTDIKKQARRLADLTDELILLSKTEEGSYVPVREELDLTAITEQQIELFRVAAAGNGRIIESSVEPDVRITGDSKAIERLVSILLDNAVKYCPEGKTVKLSLQRSGKNAIIEVSNPTDSPIDEKSLDYLFDRFYRADASRNSETGGHGIGLSVAKAITEAHSGKIAAYKDGDNIIRFRAVLRS